MSFGPQLEEGGEEGIVRLGRVVPCQVPVDLLNVPSQLLLPMLWYSLQYRLQVLHLTQNTYHNILNCNTQLATLILLMQVHKDTS